jgi:hypothetical protein
MTRPNPFTELANRDSPAVQDALTRRCEVCKAKPGDECNNTIAGIKPLAGRLVHYARTEA